MRNTTIFSPAAGLDDLRKSALALPGPASAHRGDLLKMIDRLEALENEMRDFTRRCNKASAGPRPVQPHSLSAEAALSALLSDPSLGGIVRAKIDELQQARLPR